MPDSFDTTVPEWFVTEIADGVIDIFQDKGSRLKSTLRSRSVTEAKELEFHIFGTLSTVKKAPGPSDIPLQNAAHSKKVITPDTDFVAAFIERTDFARMKEDDKDNYKRAGGKALARRADDIIVSAAALTSTSSLTGAGASVFYSPILSEQIESTFADNDIDEDCEIYNIVSVHTWRCLDRFPEFNNADYIGADLPFARSTRRGARTWNGQHWIRFNRLPKTGNIRTNFAWTPEALAHVSLEDLFLHFAWENLKNGWSMNMNMDQGAGILQDIGILPVKSDESIAPESIDPTTYSLAA